MTYYFELEFYENIDEWAIDYSGIVDPFEVKIPIAITNTYSSTLWFKGELDSPPVGYSDYSLQLGDIAAGQSEFKTFTFKRTHPGAKVTDNLTLKVTAYIDASYSTELCNDSLSVPLYLFSHSAMVLVDNDTFDTVGDFEGWTAVGDNLFALYQYSTHFINAPYSLQGETSCPGGKFHAAAKTFTVPVATEAFLIFHYYKVSNHGVGPITIDGVSAIPTPILEECDIGKWYRFALKIPTGKDVVIKFYSEIDCGLRTYQVWDDVWVVTT